MYNFLDSSGYIATLYFPMIVIVGNFFILKLFLAVIMSVFSEIHESQEEEEKRVKKEEMEARETPMNRNLKYDDFRSIVNKEMGKTDSSPIVKKGSWKLKPQAL